MLSPKQTKFRKYHRGKMRGKVIVWFYLFYVLIIFLQFFLKIYTYYVVLKRIINKMVFVLGILLLRYVYFYCLKRISNLKDLILFK